MTKVGAVFGAVVVVAGLAVASSAVAAVLTSDDASPIAAPEPARHTRLSPAEAVDFWSERSAARPNDFISRTHLAASQLRYARSSGDDSAYAAASENAQAALELHSDYEPAITTLGAAQLAAHDFRSAAETARVSLELDANSVAALSLLGDAAFDAGDVDIARSAYRELATLDQSAPVLSRLARLASFDEGPDQGLALAEQAMDAATGSDATDEDLNFYRIQLASYHFAVGDLESAFAPVEHVLEKDPNHPLALFWQGRLLAAEGDIASALTSFEGGLAAQRHPEFVAEYAAMHLALGNDEVAQDLLAEAVAGASEGALDAPGATSGPENRHLVHILSDHGITPARAVALAAAEIVDRADSAGYDALAWAYYRNGDFESASDASAAARSAGVPTAEMLYHGGVIAESLGDFETARRLIEQALEINPYFDLLKSVEADKLLDDLSGG